MIADDDVPDPIDRLHSEGMEKHLARHIDALPERERQVVRYRFGLETGERTSLERIGEIFGVTRERIRQIESRAMTKLRASARDDIGLREYLD